MSKAWVSRAYPELQLSAVRDNEKTTSNKGIVISIRNFIHSLQSITYRMSSSSFSFFLFLPFVPITFSLPSQSLFPPTGQLGIGHRLESEIGSSARAAFATVPVAQETVETIQTINKVNKLIVTLKSFVLANKMKPSPNHPNKTMQNKIIR